MKPCSACGAEVAGPACSDCGALQPLSRSDPFSVLGLPAQMRLERKAIESAFRERSKLVHPDRHNDASEAQKLLALKHTNAVNEAYQLLKDPRRRAALMMAAAGHPLDEDNTRTEDPKLLMALMELRESLDEMDRFELEAKESELKSEVRKLIEVAAEHFDDGKHSLDEVETALHKVRYFERLLELVDERVERLS